MQEHRTATAGNSRRAIVIDLDNKVIEVVVSFQTVATAMFVPPHRPVVVAALRGFSPSVLRNYRANRQKRSRSRGAIGAPPQPPGPGRAPLGAAGPLPPVSSGCL